MKCLQYVKKQGFLFQTSKMNITYIIQDDMIGMYVPLYSEILVYIETYVDYAP